MSLDGQHESAAEPTFVIGERAEAALQKAFVRAVHDVLKTKNVSYAILEGSGLDVSVFIEAPQGARFRQFELKTHTQSSGRIGVSQGQLRLLCDMTERQLSVVDTSIRWILADCEKQCGSTRYVFFTCREAKRAMSGGSQRRPIQNYNLNSGKLTTDWATWDSLMHQTELFLLN
jgi:hypothetical protein